jgi:hypothetical protein
MLLQKSMYDRDNGLHELCTIVKGEIESSPEVSPRCGGARFAVPLSRTPNIPNGLFVMLRDDGIYMIIQECRQNRLSTARLALDPQAPTVVNSASDRLCDVRIKPSRYHI